MKNSTVTHGIKVGKRWVADIAIGGSAVFGNVPFRFNIHGVRRTFLKRWADSKIGNGKYEFVRI